MGVGAMIGAVLLSGVLQGRAQKQQAKAQAAQAETNAQIAYNNSKKLQEQAELQAQNNALNEENKRRRLLQQNARNITAVGKSGISMSGSALMAMGDSSYNQEMELAIDRYNGRQKVDNIFQSSTDNLNQGDIYKQDAANYRKAGKRAMMNAILQSAVQAAGIYASGTAGKTGSSTKTSNSGWVRFDTGASVSNDGFFQPNGTFKTNYYGK